MIHALHIPLRKQVKEASFKLLSPQEIKNLAKAKIITPELYDIDGYPVDGGLMDLRMGAIDPGVRCRTCGGSFKECLGHYGYIELARPVIHIKFVPIIELLLRTTCQYCGRILTTKKITRKEIKKLRNVKKCPHCNRPKEKIKLEKPYFFYKAGVRMFPSEIREWLEKIPDEDLRLYGYDPSTFRPENAILTVLLVPPVTVRPSITLETGERSEDDLTHKLSDIIRTNQRFWENINAGVPEVIIEDLWDLLQYHVATFIDNDISQLPPARHRSGQKLKTITERIKGKEGHIRHNLAGKRTNFSARTVISPDPFIKINEVGVPFEIARILTIPERVTRYNIEYLKNLIANYPNYPSAEYVIRPNGQKRKITEETKEDIIKEIDVGYIVERHLIDGDIVLFNRHPTLHKGSLMAHFVKVLPGKTFRLHPSICFPFNADFDGDEMNIHAPQTEEARAEAKILLDSENMLIGQKNNTNMIGLIMDGITGCYLLSKDEISREEAIQLIIEAGIDINNVDEKIFEKEKIKGTEIISLVLPSNLNLEIKTRECSGAGCVNCSKPNSPCRLVIKNGKIVRGVVDANALAPEKDGLIKALDAIVDRKEVVRIVKILFSLGSIYLTKKGFSIGLSDFKPDEEIIKETEKIIKKAYEQHSEVIEQYHSKKLEPFPGKTLEESREIILLKLLNEVRTKIGEKIKEIVKTNNPVRILINSGAVGNILNLIQIMGSVGQQSLWGKRIEIGFKNRTLSFFKEFDLSPESRGFISSSYYKGLNPYEFFFASITGRDGLMDTALRTPKSGYLYRRLVNALQDIRVEYDNTVRDSSGQIIEFLYGDDGIDPGEKHKGLVITPGEPIGVITSQSFGEPATQMTLNVFHFAGVSEMQITLGLPRLIEIFDARKEPSTPQMEIYLEKEYNNEKDAKKIAEKIKEIKLKDVAEEINVDYAERKIRIILDKKALSEKNLSIDKIYEMINIKGFKKSLRENVITLSEIEEGKLSKLYKVKQKLKDLHVGGIKGITQILIKKVDKDYVILTSGSNLKEVLKIKGVNKEKIFTNNLFEMYEVFGIEVAREAIIREVKKILKEQGLDIDERHIRLVADAMCASGEIKGTTRLGIIEDKHSVLARASFETPITHFITACIEGISDRMSGVIENILLNQPAPVGTGLPGLLVKVTDLSALAFPKFENKKR
jgi:DNA-directed RNA polymerase subunit A'